MRRLIINVLKGLTAIIIILFAIVYFSSERFKQFGGRPTGVTYQRIQSSPQYNGKRFENPTPSEVGSPAHFRETYSKIFFGDERREPEMVIPVLLLDSTSFTAEPPDGLRITWLGHSTVLIEMDQYRILTDPVWAKRVSPFSYLGPARFHEVPIALDQLPQLNAVLISHDHYDHLDKNTIIALAGTGVQFILPLGVGAHLTMWGIDSTQINELDWWETWASESGGLEVTATPAYHFSGRSPLNINHTLWASWVLVSSSKRVYFSGDSGPFPGFEEIGRKYGPFDITLVKMGAYDEGWPDIHLNPDQAIDAHIALSGRLLQPIHWGTFNLAFHDWYEPAVWLLREARRREIFVVIPKPGEMVNPADPSEVEEWWLPDLRR